MFIMTILTCCCLAGSVFNGHRIKVNSVHPKGGMNEYMDEYVYQMPWHFKNTDVKIMVVPEIRGSPKSVGFIKY